LIPAAGMGLRLGCDGPKALVELAGLPMIARTLTRFSSIDLAEETVIIVPPGHCSDFESVLSGCLPDAALAYVEGGAARQDSVANGLDALSSDTEIVVIHDAARPFVDPASVQASIDAAASCGAATVAVPCQDTILMGDADAYLVDTPDRSSLWACQTPQTFQVSVIREAHEYARRQSFAGTDDASLVRRAGGVVKLVMGTPLNFKVTTPSDHAVAEVILERELL
jgi:2-C-methyl-D-erythritol 4-phosphate cytidylyltransferase